MGTREMAEERWIADPFIDSLRTTSFLPWPEFCGFFLINNWFTLFNNIWCYLLLSLLLCLLLLPALLLQLPLLTGHCPLPNIVNLSRNCKPVTSSLPSPVDRIIFSVSTGVKHSPGYFFLDTHDVRNMMSFTCRCYLYQVLQLTAH